jgi:hypothetical protein
MSNGVLSVYDIRDVEGRRRLSEVDDKTRCGPSGRVLDGDPSSSSSSSSLEENEVRRCTPKKVVAI